MAALAPVFIFIIYLIIVSAGLAGVVALVSFTLVGAGVSYFIFDGSMIAARAGGALTFICMLIVLAVQWALKMKSRLS